LTVYDEQGRRIKQLLKSLLSPGEHTVRWDATNDDDQPVASGVYFYHLILGSQRQVGKMSLVK
jgi:flagellar hook assembly protein FlgD